MGKKCMSKYDFTPDMLRTGINYSELVTVPDQVMSMYDIYMKYAVRGEIAGLASHIRPHVQDDLDLFDESVDFVPEEDIDILQRASQVRMYSSASVAADSQPDSGAVADSDHDSNSVADSDSSSPPINNKPVANPATNPASPDAGS